MINYIDYTAGIPSSINQTDFQEDPRRAAANWLAARGFESNKYTLAGLSHSHFFASNLKTTTSVFYTYLDHYEPRPFNILDEFTKGFGFRFELYSRVVVEGFGGWPEEVRADKAKMRSSARLEAEAIKMALLALSCFAPPPNLSINIWSDNRDVVNTIMGIRARGIERREIDQILHRYPTITLTAEHVVREESRIMEADKLSKITDEPMITLFVYPSRLPWWQLVAQVTMVVATLASDAALPSSSFLLLFLLLYIFH